MLGMPQNCFEQKKRGETKSNVFFLKMRTPLLNKVNRRGAGLFLNMGSGGSKIQSGTQFFWQIYFVPKTPLFAFLGFTRAVVGSISKIGQFFDHLNFLKI